VRDGRVDKSREVFEQAFAEFADIGLTAVKADMPEGMTAPKYAAWIDSYGLAPRSASSAIRSTKPFRRAAQPPAAGSTPAKPAECAGRNEHRGHGRSWHLHAADPHESVVEDDVVEARANVSLSMVSTPKSA
jgi:hypothetical protein